MVSPVPVLSIVFCIVTALICFGIPVWLAVHCIRKAPKGPGLMAICTGAICFIVSALVLEQILHSIVLNLFPALTQIPAAYILYGCLAAGVFEETARLLGLRYLCKRQGSSAVIGLGYGVGHGGIEAIMLAGTAMISNVMIMVTINLGDAETLLAGLEGDTYNAALTQLQQVAEIPSTGFLASGVERLVAMGMHIALSMLIWMVVTKRLPKWGYVVAILLHALTNVPAGMYQAGVLTNMWLVEALTAVVVVCIGLAVWKLYQTHREAPVASQPAQ